MPMKRVMRFSGGIVFYDPGLPVLSPVLAVPFCSLQVFFSLSGRLLCYLKRGAIYRTPYFYNYTPNSAIRSLQFPLNSRPLSCNDFFALRNPMKAVSGRTLPVSPVVRSGPDKHTPIQTDAATKNSMAVNEPGAELVQGSKGGGGGSIINHSSRRGKIKRRKTPIPV